MSFDEAIILYAIGGLVVWACLGILDAFIGVLWTGQRGAAFFVGSGVETCAAGGFAPL